MMKHSGDKRFKCDVCPESFMCRVSLDRHVKQHGVEPKVFPCVICFKELASAASLRSHTFWNHTKAMNCEICNLELPTRLHVRQHVDLMHSQEPSVCGICHKSFKLPSRLKTHEKRHLDSKNERTCCQFCSNKVTFRNMRAHVFRKHSEEFLSWQTTNPTL